MSDPEPLRILFAEDEQFLREFIAKQLQASGYGVEAVSSGEAALAAFLVGPAPDILLTDINMAGPLDGWALAQRCRDLHPGLGVIYATSEPRDTVRQLPGSEFVGKPYQLPAILAAIHRITERPVSSPEIT